MTHKLLSSAMRNRDTVTGLSTLYFVLPRFPLSFSVTTVLRCMIFFFSGVFARFSWTELDESLLVNLPLGKWLWLFSILFITSIQCYLLLSGRSTGNGHVDWNRWRPESNLPELGQTTRFVDLLCISPPHTWQLQQREHVPAEFITRPNDAQQHRQRRRRRPSIRSVCRLSVGGTVGKDPCCFDSRNATV